MDRDGTIWGIRILRNWVIYIVIMQWREKKTMQYLRRRINNYATPVHWLDCVLLQRHCLRLYISFFFFFRNDTLLKMLYDWRCNEFLYLKLVLIQFQRWTNVSTANWAILIQSEIGSIGVVFHFIRLLHQIHFTERFSSTLMENWDIRSTVCFGRYVNHVWIIG